MINKIKIILPVGLLAGLFFVSSCVYAQPGEGYGEGKREGFKQEMKDKFVEELGLTPEQQQQLKDQRQEHRKQTQALHKDLKAKREELKEALTKANIDEAQVQSIASEIKVLEGKLVDLRIDGVLAVKQILTPEQFVKFQEKMENVKKRHKRKGKQGWGGRNKNERKRHDYPDGPPDGEE